MLMGQSTSRINDIPHVADLLERTVKEAEETLKAHSSKIV
jgi:hypothetical protein